MNTHKVIWWLHCLLILVLASGCAQSMGSSPTLPPVSFTLAPTRETPVYTKTPVPSPTIVSTLPANDARKRLLDLLINNGDCRLPCLWGIAPGMDTYQEAQGILVPISTLSTLTSFIPEGGAIFPTYAEGDSLLAINVGFNVDTRSGDQIVHRLSLQARELKKVDNGFTEVFDSTLFDKYLGYYMLTNILTEYGNPTTVMISTMAKLPSSGVPGGFKILLLYPDQGMLVNYSMQMQVTDDNIIGCPSNSHVEIELYPPGQADSFLAFLEPSGWTQTIQKTYKPLDEATSMSQEDFYRIFSQQTDECIRTPANMWPVPD